MLDRPSQMRYTSFESNPLKEVLCQGKEPNNPLRWHFGTEGAWVHKIAYVGAQDRETINRVYAGVVAMMREEKGIDGQSR